MSKKQGRSRYNRGRLRRLSQNRWCLFVLHRDWDEPSSSSSSIFPRNKHRSGKFWFAEPQGSLFQVPRLELLPSSSPYKSFSSRKLRLGCLPQSPWPPEYYKEMRFTASLIELLLCRMNRSYGEGGGGVRIDMSLP